MVLRVVFILIALTALGAGREDIRRSCELLETEMRNVRGGTVILPESLDARTCRITIQGTFDGLQNDTSPEDRAASALEAHAWVRDPEHDADGPNGTSFLMRRAGASCAVIGQWDEHDDEESAPSTPASYEMTARCLDANHKPAEGEFRAELWLSIIAGVKTLEVFAYNIIDDTGQAGMVRKVIAEVNPLAGLIGELDRNDSAALSAIYRRASSPIRIRSFNHRQTGAEHVVVVNADPTAPQPLDHPIATRVHPQPRVRVLPDGKWTGPMKLKLILPPGGGAVIEREMRR